MITNPFIIHKIAFYSTPTNAKLFFYSFEYLKLIKSSFFHFEQLWLKFAKIPEYIDDLRVLQICSKNNLN